MDGTHREHPGPAQMASGSMRMRAIPGLAGDRAIRLSPDDDRARGILAPGSDVFGGVDPMGDEAARHDPRNAGERPRSTAWINEARAFGVRRQFVQWVNMASVKGESSR